MAQYMALYRKFRPITFDDVVGQEHIIKVLQHQIANHQIGHAYLFCGSRGTGKTTTAKILSRAINCAEPKNGEPCNECLVCKGILDASIPDVMEIDAASNNSVDDIRAIRENVIYAPTMAKYKVYIIDEVHMLSGSAFNALLKTLEEPPENVIFILATTEPHKIPVTILSRCQRFEFKRISKEDIAKRLEVVCEKNGVKAEFSALMIIAQSAEGALRDGLSLLDQVISSGVSEITESVAREILGIAEVSQTAGILTAILNKDIANMLSLVNSVVDSGKDIKYFVWEIISLARDVLVYKNTRDTNLIKNFTLLKEIEELEKVTDNSKLGEIITYLSELEANIKGATFPNILLESSLIQLISGTTKQVTVTTEKTVTKQVNIANQASNPVEKNIMTEPIQKQESKIVQTEAKVASGSGNWRDIIDHLRGAGKMSLYATLVSTKANIEKDSITVYFAQEFGKNVIERPENMSSLKTSIKAILGAEIPVKCVVQGKENVTSSDAENSLINSGIDVNIL